LSFFLSPDIKCVACDDKGAQCKFLFGYDYNGVF